MLQRPNGCLLNQKLNDAFFRRLQRALWLPGHEVEQGNKGEERRLSLRLDGNPFMVLRIKGLQTEKAFCSSVFFTIFLVAGATGNQNTIIVNIS